VLTIALVSHSHCDYSRSPVTDKALRSGIEDRLGANSLRASSVDLRRPC
jgi:hypothetical protein